MSSVKSPPLHQPPSPELLNLVAQRFAVLAEPHRLRLLHTLLQGESSVTALVEATGLTQTNVSRHLQTLARGGFVERRKMGTQVLYRVADPSVFELCQLVCGRLEERLREQMAALGSGR